MVGCALGTGNETNFSEILIVLIGHSGVDLGLRLNLFDLGGVHRINAVRFGVLHS